MNDIRSVQGYIVLYACREILREFLYFCLYSFGNVQRVAARLLEEILRLCSDESKTYYLGGYSLAGLFSLWASYQTDRFAGIAAASPSVWFPGFLPYMKEHENQSRAVYLSLGDKEEKTRNPVMTTVGDCIREAHAWLQQCGIGSTLEWNPGNHFRDPGLRTAKAFAWVMKNS